MRILILTHSEDRHFTFVKIIEHTNKVVGVITNAKGLNKTQQEKISKIFKRNDTKSFLKKKILNRVFFLKNKYKGFLYSRNAINLKRFLNKNISPDYPVLSRERYMVEPNFHLFQKQILKILRKDIISACKQTIKTRKHKIFGIGH